MSFSLKKLTVVFLIIFLLFYKSKAGYEPCLFGYESCSCENKIFSIPFQSMPGIPTIQMNCFNKSDTQINLNFGELKPPISKLPIQLNIKNKSYFMIDTSNNMYATVISLDLSFNKIKTIEKDSFRSFPNLVYLTLIGNRVSINDSSLFTGLKKLYVLSLTDNLINKIDNTTFLNQVSLLALFLNVNELVDLPEGIFSKMFNLNYLSLDENKIEQIKYGVFNNLKNLRILRLDQNRISFIEKNAFDNLTKLEMLTLFSNKLKKIQIEMLGNLVSLDIEIFYNELYEINLNVEKNLAVLNLFGNRLTILKPGLFNNLTYLGKLILNNNEVKIIEKGSFQGLDLLTHLVVDFNKIKVIENGLFENLISLRNISLNFNKIEKIQINLPFLIQFNISNNLINEIGVNSFANCSSLDWLDLSNNRILKIKNNSFKDLANLNYLNLSKNYLDGDSEGIFNGLINLNHLDLGFNYIRVLEKNFFKYLDCLKRLFLNNNQLKIIEPGSFDTFKYLSYLNLDNNYLYNFDGINFANMGNVQTLSLKFNFISSITVLKSTLKYLNNLETIDLSSNLIESVKKNDFEFNYKLRSLTLNDNLINFIENSSFESLKNLKVLKVSKNKLSRFDLSLIASKNISELDLSYNNISFDIKNMSIFCENIKAIRLDFSSVTEKSYLSFEVFIQPSITLFDFSHYNFKNNFTAINIMVNIEFLILKSVNLSSMVDIEFQKFVNLLFLDLSFNKLKSLNESSFKNLNKLVYLDLSFNQIEAIDKTIFKIINKLRYLNLENNRITSIGTILSNYLDINIIKISNNFLEEFPVFSSSTKDLVISATLRDNIEHVPQYFRELFLQNNKIKSIKPFSMWTSYLEIVNFESNEISVIEIDAFLDLKMLKNLSISKNHLTNLTRNNFLYLFSLEILNLSFNRINVIEKNTFETLKKLISLDLSFNNIKTIENNIFHGLVELNVLQIESNFEFELRNESFGGLENLGNVYINFEMMIGKNNLTNKCIFMHSIERIIRRNVSSKYIYYKSLNLITPQFSFGNNTDYFCELALNLLQFKVHFNTKSDFENEIFYDSCDKILIKTNNNYNHTLKKCFTNFQINEESLDYHINEMHPILKVLTTDMYLISMGLIMMLLVPAFVYILIFHEIPKFVKSKSLPKKEELTNMPQKIEKPNNSMKYYEIVLNDRN